MEKFLGRHKLEEMIQEELEYVNRPIVSKIIKPGILKLPTTKSPGPNDFTGELYQIFKEESIPVLCKLFRKIKEGLFFNTLYQVSVSIADAENGIATILQTNSPYEYRYKDLDLGCRR